MPVWGTRLHEKEKGGRRRHRPELWRCAPVVVKANGRSALRRPSGDSGLPPAGGSVDDAGGALAAGEPGQLLGMGEGGLHVLVEGHSVGPDLLLELFPAAAELGIDLVDRRPTERRTARPGRAAVSAVAALAQWALNMPMSNDPSRTRPVASIRTGGRLRSCTRPTMLRALEHVVADVVLPPEEALASRCLVVVVVVVPALAQRDERDERRVAARVGRGVATPAHHVGQRVHRERAVPQQHRREEEAEDQAAPAADEVAATPRHPRADPVVLVQPPQLGVLGEVLDVVGVPVRCSCRRGSTRRGSTRSP